MSYLKETAAWEEGIYQIETSDPVLGGPDGITNRPTRELANRTAWLKLQLQEAEAALTAHTRSRNHPDASLSEKGFVKLSNANQSSSETEAATPKAVKIVNDRLNAVIDSAPSTLDTLNKLAKAIDNNPKFAEKLNQLLEQKLSKNDNGADIPDKNLFLKNLGLLETIDCAKNALDKRTGGTVNGNLHVTQSVHIGDNDSGLRANGDGKVAFYANSAKVGDWSNASLHWLGNAEVDGTINTHSNLVVSWGGRTAVYHENGDITGPIWGGTLRGWLDNTFVRDIRLGNPQHAVWGLHGGQAPNGHVLIGGNFDDDREWPIYAPIQKNINGKWITISMWE
ncbi:MAG: hypothetical protein HamCj_09810 [Candidatus Hamiltonella defensa (Ceratovacuna japonica)]